MPISLTKNAGGGPETPLPANLVNEIGGFPATDLDSLLFY
jgi:hypothetical protein